MKKLLIFNFFFLSSCALYDSYRSTEFNWLGSTNHPVAKQQTPAIVPEKKENASEALASSVVFEEMISKNWEYLKRKDPLSEAITYEATTLTEDKSASLTILKNDLGRTAVIIGLNKDKVSYREGHSIVAKIDSETLLYVVMPSEGKASKEVHLRDGEKFSQLLNDKNNLEVELTINGKGSKAYKFNIPGLQKFFTTN